MHELHCQLPLRDARVLHRVFRPCGDIGFPAERFAVHLVCKIVSATSLNGRERVVEIAGFCHGRSGFFVDE